MGVSNSLQLTPASFDATFNHGDFEVTPMSYRHHLVESKSRNICGEWSNAVIIGPVIIHHGKTEEVYDDGT